MSAISAQRSERPIDPITGLPRLVSRRPADTPFQQQRLCVCPEAGAAHHAVVMC